MTVGELIEKLICQDPDKLIVFSSLGAEALDFTYEDFEVHNHTTSGEQEIITLESTGEI